MLLLIKLRFKIKKSLNLYLVTIAFTGIIFACNKKAKVAEKVDLQVQTER